MAAHVGPSLTGFFLTDSLLSRIAFRAAALSAFLERLDPPASAGLLLLDLWRFFAVRSISSSPLLLLLSNSSTSSSGSAGGGQCFQRSLRTVVFAGGE